MSVECDVCGDDFKSKIAVQVHRSKSHYCPWKDKEKLEELYIDERLSTVELSEKWGISRNTVCKNLKKHSIETRDKSTALGGPGYSGNDVEEMYTEEGLTIVEIAEKLDVDNSNIYRALKRRGVDTSYDGEDHHSWSGGDIDYECDWCGNSMSVERGLYNNRENHFCGDECLYRWRSDNLSNEKTPDKNRYGPLWTEKRRERLEKDNYSCVVCGMTQNKHKEKYDESLHVHHIITRRKYQDENGNINWEVANDINNLVTLCTVCHPRWEGIPLRPQQ
jgi:5-methylcytosine-specific restriction endonuclease McrA/predicted DNA-binding protein YlxM (UPF0122 family)